MVFKSYLEFLLLFKFFFWINGQEGGSKVMVALGFNGSLLSDVEIIDLLSSETTCQTPGQFPSENWLAVGIGGLQDKPLICGGKKHAAACHQYEDGAWKSSYSLTRERFDFAMTKSPFKNAKLFLTGGIYNTNDDTAENTVHEIGLDSTEVLTETGWQESVPMPIPIYRHCMVAVNSTTVIVIGGIQNGIRSSAETFFFNSETNIWTKGPTMTTSRREHSCGWIRKNSLTQEKSIIAVGGIIIYAFTGSAYLKSVDVLDLDSGIWRQGPPLPFPICCGSLVEDPSGGVVLLGGSREKKVLNTLYRLRHAGPDAEWEWMPTKLKTARHYHTAFLIPDEIADCNYF